MPLLDEEERLPPLELELDLELPKLLLLLNEERLEASRRRRRAASSARRLAASRASALAMA